MKKLVPSIALVAAMLLPFGCNFNPDQLVPPQWDTQFIGPLLRTNASLDNILDIGDQQFQEEFVICDLIGQPNCQGQIIVPPIPPTDLPSDTISYTDIYNQITLDSGILNLDITNTLPFNVKAGLVIEIKNTDGSIVVSFTLSQDLAANNGSASFTDDLAGKSLTSEFILAFRNFASDGTGGNTVTITGDEKIGFVFNVITLKVRSVSLVPGNVFTLTDTSAFTLDDGIVINSEPLTGTLNILADNQFAAGFVYQAVFLDDLNNVVETLFDSVGILFPDSLSTLSVEVTEETILNLKAATSVASRMDWVAIPNNPSFDAVELFNTDSLKATLVAELKVRVKP